MIFLRTYFSAVLFVMGMVCVLAAQNDFYQIRIPTATEEAEYLWQNLIQYSFFQENGYNIALPENEEFVKYLQLAKNSALSSDSFDEFVAVFTKHIYNPADYQSGFDKIIAEMHRLAQMDSILSTYQLAWDFYLPPHIDVVLTLYGPGGSYNPEQARMIIFTTATGEFKNSADPVNIILHETVHIGVEQPIVQKFHLSHWQKERLVDRMIYENFLEIVPNYHMQNLSDVSIDSVIAHINWLKLDKYLK